MGEGVVGLLQAVRGSAVLDPGGIQPRGELASASCTRRTVTSPASLAAAGLELVDVPGREAQLALDVLERRARTDPELAVAGVGEELVAVTVAERAEVQHGLVALLASPSSPGTGSMTSTASGSRSAPRPVSQANAVCGRKT